MINALFDRIIFSDIIQKPINRTELNVNIDALKYSIQNLLSTEKGERLNLVKYGVSLPEHLFDPMDEITAWRILNSVIFAINEWEPRVEVDRAKSYVTPDYDENRYELYLVLTIVGYPGLDFEVNGVYKRLTS